MKTQDIKRGIISRHRREGGEGPGLGRMVRVRSAEMPSGEARVRRRGERGNPARKKVALTWSIVVGAVAVAVICLSISLWVWPYLFPQTDENLATQVPREVLVRVESKFPSPSKEHTLELVSRALLNRDPAKVPSLFRLGSASSSEIVDFCKTLEARDGPVERYEWMSSMDVNGMLVEGVLVIFKSREKPLERLALLTPDPSGNWKLDFEAYARAVRPSWNELLEKGANEALVRVFAGPDVYFNGPFKDEAQWACYGVASPDIDPLLRGYCKIGSPQALAMAKVFADGRKMSRATLVIRRVEGAESRQFEIIKVLSDDWIVAEPPAEHL